MISFENGTKEEPKVHREKQRRGPSHKLLGCFSLSWFGVDFVGSTCCRISVDRCIQVLLSNFQGWFFVKLLIFLVIAILFTLLLGWIVMVWKNVALDAY